MNFMKHTRRSFKLTAALLALCMTLTLCACGEDKYEQSSVYAMDTYMTLTAYGKNAAAGLTAAEGVIRSMDSMLDPEQSSGTVYQLNHAAGKEVVVSGQIAEMLSTAKEVYDRSKGALDLTVYPLVKLWGFEDGKYYVPEYSAIVEARKRRCFNTLTLTSYPVSGSYTVSMAADGEISFGAVAKGCAADYAIEAMRNAGVDSGIISLGGNVQTLGLKPDGEKWKVAVQDPNNQADYVGVLEVGEAAVVTSGSYQRNFTSDDGTFYHHIIDPSTGSPANNTLVSVTIVCEDGTLADCLSTAMFVLGRSAALNYWRQYGGFEMVMVTRDNEVICTSGLIEEFTLANSGYTLSFSE